MCINTCIGPLPRYRHPSPNPWSPETPSQPVTIVKGKLTTCYELSCRVQCDLFCYVCARVIYLRHVYIASIICHVYLYAFECYITCLELLCVTRYRGSFILQYDNPRRVLPEWSEFRHCRLNTFQGFTPNGLNLLLLCRVVVWVITCLWWSVMTLSHPVIANIFIFIMFVYCEVMLN